MGEAPNSRKALYALAILAILVFGVLHRWVGIINHPFPNQTSDEYAFAWAGLNLIDSGTPTSWSFLGVYERSLDAKVAEVDFRGYDLQIVSPWFDHPPLYCLLVGSYAHVVPVQLERIPVSESHAIWEFSLARLRSLSILLYILTYIFLADLAFRHQKPAFALVTLLLFSTLQIMATHQRLLVAESLTTPLFLLQLCLLSRYLRDEVPRWLFGMSTIVLIAAALLSKVVAVSMAVPVFILLLANNRTRDIVWPIAGALLGVVVYIGSGVAIDGNAFFAVLAEQGYRFTNFDSMYKMMLIPLMVHDFGLNAPIFFGWFSLLALAMLRRELIFIAPILYLAGMVFFAAADMMFGWHLIFLYPFFCIAMADALAFLLRTTSPHAIAVFAVLTIPVCIDVARKDFGIGDTNTLRLVYMITIASILVAVYTLSMNRRQALNRILIPLVTTIILFGEFNDFRRLSASSNGRVDKPFLEQPGYTFRASSHYHDEDNQVSYSVANLFDGERKTMWSALESDPWMEFDLREPARLTVLRVCSGPNDRAHDPQRVAAYGSDDGATWELIHESKIDAFPGGKQWQEFEINTAKDWDKYRLEFRARETTHLLQLGELEVRFEK